MADPPRCPFNPERIFKGLAVPFTILWRAASKRPDFTALDPSRHTRAIQRQLCGICGQPLDYRGEVVWIGGAQKAPGDAVAVFVDPPMHEACARYSAAACPFLALGQKRMGEDLPGGGYLEPEIAPDTGEYFLHFGRGVRVVKRGSGLYTTAVEALRSEPIKKVVWGGRV